MARDFYERSRRRQEGDRTKRSRRRTASSRGRTIPTATPDDRAAEERFKEIQGAYDTLSDPEKRREYDSGGPFGFDPRNFAGGAAQNLGDIFSFFTRGRGGGADARQRPRDRCLAHVRPGDDRHRDHRHRSQAGRVHDLRRFRRQARHGAAHVPALPRAWRRLGEPGLLLDLAAVPAVRRPRPGRR